MTTPSRPLRSPYITAAGYTTLQAELQQLWTRRQGVVEALAAAAAEGDRSENAEYIYRKKELREIDRRIRYLQKRLPELRPISDTPADTRYVYFGAWVTVEDLATGTEHQYRLVGTDEYDPNRHWISIDSPVARALLKHMIGDTVQIMTPGGASRLRILAIRYSD